MGLLLNAQADKAEEYWGSKLQITVFLCNQNSTAANCVNGEVTTAQKDAVRQVLSTNAEVSSYRLEGKQQAYDKWREAYVSDNDTERRVYDAIKPSDMQESYWVQLEDPEKFQGVKSAVAGLPGVATVRDLRAVLKPIYFWMNVMKWGAISIASFLVVAAVLQVGNTIRLAAFARRREIGIMRLVGRLQPLHPAAVPDGVPGGRPDRGEPLGGGVAAVHVGRHLQHAETVVEHRGLDRLEQRDLRHRARSPRSGWRSR